MSTTTVTEPMKSMDREGGQLKEFLDLLSEFSPRFYPEQEEAVATEVGKNGHPSALEQIKQEPPLQIGKWIADWNRRLRLNLTQPTPRERVLCGTNAVADVIYQLNADELAAFGSWINTLSPNVKSQGERMKGMLKEAMQNPSREWKLPLDRVIWQPLQDFVTVRVQARAPISFRMGGASGNMAYVLSELGLETIVHWYYHSQEIADDFATQNMSRFLLDNGQVAKIPATIYGTYNSGPGYPQPDPARRSFCFEFSRGLPFDGITASDNGRVIFLTDQHMSSVVPRSWSRLFLRNKTPTGGTQDIELESGAANVLGSDGWPLFPLFASKHVDQDKLIIEIASDEMMEQIARQTDYFMLGGIQHLGNDLHRIRSIVNGNPSEPTVGTIVKHALKRQLDILAHHGVVIHWEIGGIRSPQFLDELADLARGRIISASLNPSELNIITGDAAYRHTRFFYEPTSIQSNPPSEILTRYDRAVHLARQMDLDELYVHGNDVDLIVRRRTTRGALRQEIAATLFAKGVVLLALLKRSYPDTWRNQIEEKDVPPILTAKSFLALLTLAKEVAMRLFPRDAPMEKRTFHDILQSGYYFERDPEKYSLMVIPIMWPDLSLAFGVTGGGDITSSVVAIFAGK